jgi:hypothetical protein
MLLRTPLLAPTLCCSPRSNCLRVTTSPQTGREGGQRPSRPLAVRVGGSEREEHPPSSEPYGPRRGLAGHVRAAAVNVRTGAVPACRASPGTLFFRPVALPSARPETTGSPCDPAPSSRLANPCPDSLPPDTPRDPISLRLAGSGFLCRPGLPPSPPVAPGPSWRPFPARPKLPPSVPSWQTQHHPSATFPFATLRRPR